MKDMLNKSSNEMLREYFYDLRGCYPPEDFSREQIINVLLKDFNK